MDDIKDVDEAGIESPEGEGADDVVVVTGDDEAGPGGNGSETKVADAEIQTGEPSDIAVSDEVLPEKLAILPLNQKPLFPGTIFPLIINGSETVELIRETFYNGNKYLGAVLVKPDSEQAEAESENGESEAIIEPITETQVNEDDLFEVGTVVRIHKFGEIHDEDGVPVAQILVQTMRRFRKVKQLRSDKGINWRVSYYDRDPTGPDEEIKAYTMAIISSVKELLKLNPLFQEQLKMLMNQLSFDNPGKIMDLIASMTSADSVKLQSILEAVPLKLRADRLMLILHEEMELSKLQEKIRKNIEEKISKQQKEFFLQEQLKAIKKELGLEKDDKTAEIDKFKERLKGQTLPEDVEAAIQKEMDNFSLLEPSSPEYHVSRNYLDWLTLLPWGKTTDDNFDLKKAAEILDRDHFGLDDIKSEILEFISVGNKRGKLGGNILLLVGPPGVGKTSIGKSIAEALGRKFFRFSVGGMRDEAEIKGHRRTYIGAMPGKFIQALKGVDANNPVIMLDEIDKIGTSFRGDPASALLEVLDPEQNKDFLDHYLDVRFDLSNVLFIATANQLDTIPGPLLDRMVKMQLSGYIEAEKLVIAERYLVPKALKDFGYEDGELTFESDAVKQIIHSYAREAGVRNLEKHIRKVLRKVTLKKAREELKSDVVRKDEIADYLGLPIFQEEELYNKDTPGVALGLAWTSMGGATLYVEATRFHNPGGSGGYKQTGQLGDVMKESSEIAYSFVRSRFAKKAGAKGTEFFKNNFFHLHVPAGATPKDGPSAGITMALALYSLVTGKVVRPDIAMTGELTLTGKVLPIGGVKEKIIAAKRVGVHEVILPKENKKDYVELPSNVKEGVTVHFANYFQDVLDVVYRT